MDRNVITELERLAPVTAVAGNLDSADLKIKFGQKKIITLGGFEFGVCHGHDGVGKTQNRAASCFKNDHVHCIIFGHSHIPYCQFHNGILLFNPGSPSDKRRNQYFSFGLIDIAAVLMPRIVFFDSGGSIIN